MIWAVTSLTFLLTAIVVMVLFYSFAESKVKVGERLSQLRDPSSTTRGTEICAAASGSSPRRFGVPGKTDSRVAE